MSAHCPDTSLHCCAMNEKFPNLRSNGCCRISADRNDETSASLSLYLSLDEVKSHRDRSIHICGFRNAVHVKEFTRPPQSRESGLLQAKVGTQVIQ